jgi:hypothetical protein
MNQEIPFIRYGQIYSFNFFESRKRIKVNLGGGLVEEIFKSVKKATSSSFICSRYRDK